MRPFSPAIILNPYQKWWLYCIYFGHRSLSLPQTWLLFRRGVLLLPTCLPGLESPQALRRIKSNAVLSLFWLELGQTKWPHCMLATSYTHDFRFYSKGNTLGTPPEQVPDTNYKHLEFFVMLGTHFEPRRGQMSHICEISPLRDIVYLVFKLISFVSHLTITCFKI